MPSNDLRLRRHLELTTGSDATVTSTALQYMCVLSSLRHWVDWKEEGGVAEGTRGTGLCAETFLHQGCLLRERKVSHTCSYL